MKKRNNLRVKDIGEIGLIKRIEKLLSCTDPDVKIGIGDDAAVVRPDKQLLQVMTTDTLVENIHFNQYTHTPFEIGYKSIVVNVSDIAAMAAIPRFALISIGISPDMLLDRVEDFYKGARKAAIEYGLHIIGGDTTRSPVFVVNVCLIGQVEPEVLRCRNEAEVGDKIAVTGKLGGSATGLHLLSEIAQTKKMAYADELKEAHIKPTARIKEARIAAKEGANAMEDISDGLASEIQHICERSEVGAEINAALIPIAPGVREVARLMDKDAEDLFLYGGEDFELIFTAPQECIERIKKDIEEQLGTEVTIIGEIVGADKGISLVLLDGKRGNLSKYGFEHF